MNSKLYPKSPDLSDYNFIKPSSEFLRIATSVVFSVIFFFAFYVLLIAVVAIVMVAAIWAGIKIVDFKSSAFTLVAGAGLIVLGIMLFIFLFKFIFSSTKYENPFRVEIKEFQHPELFAFIKALNKDTKTKFPKKIFLSPEVNAMVFYNSSFWSLFFPVRKNLEIGLGLVNSLTLSEFKAVLAHEFGHFSQRSMKIGSYIYTVNRVIYNLVYDYDNWDNLLRKWSQIGGGFGFFAEITFWLAESIRSLLKVAYNLININYMKLSREMEYHADLIAVSVSGNASFKNSLRKIKFSSFAYDYTIEYLNSLAGKEKKSINIYNNHSFTLSFLAKLNKISNADGTLKITDEDINASVVRSRINIKDQWASHPTLKEREENISKVNIEAEKNQQSAWTIFSNSEKVKEEVTSNLYRTGFPDTKFNDLEIKEFENFVQNEINKYRISEEYNDFYGGRYLSKFELNDLIKSNPSKGFEELYSKENIERIRRLELNKSDLEVLEQISLKQIKTKYFEFDGKKYKRKDAGRLIPEIKHEIERDGQFVVELDKESFIYNHTNARRNNSGVELVNIYQTYFDIASVLELIDEFTVTFQNFTNRLYSQPMRTDDEIRLMLTELSSIEEQFKDFLKIQNLDELIENIEPEEQVKVLREYVRSDYYYSNSSDFNEEDFINLSNLIQDVNASVGTKYGNTLKKMTDFQLDLERQYLKTNNKYKKR